MEDREMAGSGDRAIEGAGSRDEARRLKQEQRRAEERRRAWRRRLRRSVRIGVVVLVVGGAIGGLATWFWSRGDLPPTSMANHVEVNPPGHILKEPMPIPIQKHMLEHADGIHGGPQGVIIQYNCKKYSCPGDLVENLTLVARRYPSFVYLTPNYTMDARIALTREGQILVLDQYDAGKIQQFMSR
jgi:hypothetical protein